MEPKYIIKNECGWLTHFEPGHMSWGQWCHAKFLSPEEVGEVVKLIATLGLDNVITIERAG
jgi:hypothetical protein